MTSPAKTWSPARMFIALAGASAVSTCASAALVALVAPDALMLASADRATVARPLAWLAALSWLALVALAAETTRRLLPLYRAELRRLAAAPGSQPAPPSQAALRDAFATPERAARVVAATATLHALAIVLGLAGAGVLEPVVRVELALLVAAVVASSIKPTILLWRGALARWLDHVSPAEVPATAHGSLSRRLALLLASPVGTVAVGSAVVVVSHVHALDATTSTSASASASPGSAQLLGTAAAVLVVAIFAVIAAGMRALRVGRSAAQELAQLTADVRALAVLDIEAMAATSTAMRVRFRTAEATDLAGALESVAERFSGLTDREENARRAVEEAQRLKTQFMASMSHDLRSPLNSVLGFSELLLQSKSTLAPAQRESVEMIMQSGGELLRLLTDILDSARLEAGRLDMRREWTPSVEILTEAVRRGRELVGERGVVIQPELQPGLPPVHVDAHRIVQAVVGLLHHAVSAMERGTVRVRAAVASGPPGPEKQVRVQLIDDGAGLDEEQRERIFDAFREIAEPSGRRIGGLGLGLSLARSLVRVHGGDVWCESRAGAGTTFTIALPVEQTSQADSPKRPQPREAPR